MRHSDTEGVFDKMGLIVGHKVNLGWQEYLPIPYAAREPECPLYFAENSPRSKVRMCSNVKSVDLYSSS